MLDSPRFTHIVKASEPVVSAALSAVLLGAIYSPITYLTLLPIVGGVALASLKATQPRWKSCGLRPANQGSAHPYEHP